MKAHAVKRTISIPIIATNSIRNFNLLAFDCCAADYNIHLIKRENVEESPLTELFRNDIISEAIVNTIIILTPIISTIKRFSDHTRATGRIVKAIEEASSVVCSSYKSDGFTKNSQFSTRNVITTDCNFNELLDFSKV